jgi:AbrB family looped-hinge helix DNA binding protein
VPTTKLYYDGWLALPAGLREKLGLTTGDRLDVELVDGAVVLRRSEAKRGGKHADAMPARRGPGRPRKAVAPAASPEPKKARVRPPNATAAPEPAPDATPAVSNQPWKLVKKVDRQAPSADEEQPPYRVTRPGAAGITVVERRPFRNVEVRKLGPGRGHSKDRSTGSVRGSV